MVRFTTATILSFVVAAYAIGDPSGAKNVGNGRGAQFIGAECLSSKDCASGCCATAPGGGLCSGLGAQFQNGKQGCGFGDGGAAGNANNGGNGNNGNGNANNGGQNAGNGGGSGKPPGTQFITGPCGNDADCASGCCAGPKGACSARAVAFDSGKTGCGFGGAGGNNNGGTNNAGNPPAAAPPAAAPAAPAAGGDNVGSQNKGNGQGKQFITGLCSSDADCASGCCAGPKGACSARAVAFDSGKTGCGFGGAGANNNAGTNNAAAPPAAAAPVRNDNVGSQNKGNGQGKQFITGLCSSDADCASGCCAGPKGACSARAVAFDSGKTGCGFGGGAANNNGGGNNAAPPAAAPPAAAPAAGGDSVGSQNKGNGQGKQFITGLCSSDADCASGCCAGPKGACSARAVAFDSGKTGCGFAARKRETISRLARRFSA